MEALTTALVDAAHSEPDRRCLMAIADRPVIEHVLDDLARHGITNAVILTAPGHELELRRSVSCEMSVSYCERGPEGAAAGLLAHLRRTASEDPLLVHPGDCLFPDAVPALSERFTDGHGDVAVLSAAGRAAAILGAATWPGLAELSPRELSAEAGLISLAGERSRVVVCDAGEHWCYSDSTEQLLIANRMILDRLPALVSAPNVSDDSRVDGRVRISATAHVSGSTVRGPAVIGDGAVVEDSFVGPYTTIGAGATISGAELDYTMVLAGAEVRHPGHRLEASVIGELASVSRSFALPKGLHMRLGPGSRIVLG